MICHMYAVITNSVSNDKQMLVLQVICVEYYNIIGHLFILKVFFVFSMKEMWMIFFDERLIRVEAAEIGAETETGIATAIGGDV